MPAANAYGDPYTDMSNGLAKGLIALGSLHIVFGILGITLQAILLNIIPIGYSFGWIGYGIWSGIIFVITGPFGIVGGARKSKRSVIAFNILSIISVLFTALMLSLSILDTLIMEDKRIVLLAQSMGIVAMLEAIAAICSSVVYCKIEACCCDCDGGCCCPSDSNEVLVNPSRQEHVSSQQQFAMSHISEDRAISGMLANQRKIPGKTDTCYEKLNTQRGPNKDGDIIPAPSNYNAEPLSSDTDSNYLHIYDDIIEESKFA